MATASKTMEQDYDAARREQITGLYDPAFTSDIEKQIGWNDDERQVNGRLLSLKLLVTLQKGYYDNPWEAQYFTEVKDKIKGTELFGFLEAMPKGGILHVHPTAMGDYREMVSAAAANVSSEGLVYYVSYDLAVTEPWKMFFEYQPGSEADSYKQLKSEWATPAGQTKIMDLITMTTAEELEGGDPWRFFEPIFSRVGGLFYSTAVQQGYYDRAFQYLAETDNVMHVELRTSWKISNEGTAGTKEYIILQALTNVQKNYPDFTMKAIWSDSRGVNKETGQPNDPSAKIIADVVSVGTDLINDPDSRVVGYDLVGEEDTGETTEFYLPDFSEAYNQLKKKNGGQGYLPPFYFHDGESDLPPNYYTQPIDNPVPEEVYFNNNMIDAYLFNSMEYDGFTQTPGRVGHGLELFKTPILLVEYAILQLGIENCPISNQLLKYVKDIREHPGQSYLASGLPVSLSPDDPAIYTYQGVTFDFWEACIAWNLDLKALKLLCYNSLNNSALKGDNKTNAITEWKTSWYSFIETWLSTHQ